MLKLLYFLHPQIWHEGIYHPTSILKNDVDDAIPCFIVWFSTICSPVFDRVLNNILYHIEMIKWEKK